MKKCSMADEFENSKVAEAIRKRLMAFFLNPARGGRSVRSNCFSQRKELGVKAWRAQSGRRSDIKLN